MREVFSRNSKPESTNNDGIKDLFEKLAKLAIAITEEKKVNKDDDEENDEVDEKEFLPTMKYERKFGSFEEKRLKRTNLMRRRESQALLDRMRNIRGGGSKTTPQQDRETVV